MSKISLDKHFMTIDKECFGGDHDISIDYVEWHLWLGNVSTPEMTTGDLYKLVVERFAKDHKVTIVPGQAKQLIEEIVERADDTKKKQDG